MQIDILFANDRLLARAVLGGGDGPCFVTFDSFTDRPTLDRPGFGEHYFATRGIDAIHILSCGNHWYQYAELPELLAAVARVTAGRARVMAYGSSMGGFAALTYGRACGAQAGLALSPQYSIDPRVVPFERRWPGEAKRTTFLPLPSTPLPWQAIAYDPHDAADRRHAALFAARSPTSVIRVPHGGHPVGGYLSETGLLGPLVEAVAAESVDASAIETAIRAGRGRSGQYHFTLSRRSATRNLPRALALAERATVLQPHDAAYHSHFGRLLDAAGRRAAAQAAHGAAVAQPSASHHTFFNLVCHHERWGALDEARDVVERLIAAEGRATRLRQALGRIRRAQRARTRLGRLLRDYGLEGFAEALARLRDALRARRRGGKPQG